MKKKSEVNATQKYHTYRHHAWAGTGFLSICLALRLVFPEYSLYLNPLILLLTVYILFALIFTYNYYREGLVSPPLTQPTQSIISSQGEIIDAELEKARLTLEKKRIKAEVKAKKKSNDS